MLFKHIRLNKLSINKASGIKALSHSALPCCTLPLITTQAGEAGILYMKPKEVEKFAQGHTDGKKARSNLTPKPIFVWWASGNPGNSKLCDWVLAGMTSWQRSDDPLRPVGTSMCLFLWLGSLVVTTWCLWSLGILRTWGFEQNLVHQPCVFT